MLDLLLVHPPPIKVPSCITSCCSPALDVPGSVPFRAWAYRGKCIRIYSRADKPKGLLLVLVPVLVLLVEAPDKCGKYLRIFCRGHCRQPPRIPSPPSFFSSSSQPATLLAFASPRQLSRGLWVLVGISMSRDAVYSCDYGVQGSIVFG